MNIFRQKNKANQEHKGKIMENKVNDTIMLLFTPLITKIAKKCGDETTINFFKTKIPFENITIIQDIVDEIDEHTFQPEDLKDFHHSFYTKGFHELLKDKLLLFTAHFNENINASYTKDIIKKDYKEFIEKWHEFIIGYLSINLSCYTFAKHLKNADLKSLETVYKETLNSFAQNYANANIEKLNKAELKYILENFCIKEDEPELPSTLLDNLTKDLKIKKPITSLKDLG